MAKINARGARRIGPTLFTERTRAGDEYDGGRVYRQAWRLRSDGVVQTRIVRTFPAPGEEGHVTEHSSAFTNYAKLQDPAWIDPKLERLRAWLASRGFVVVEESYR